MLQTSTVASSTLELLKKLQAEPLLSSVRLVGGTALSLQIGHRESEDLDLFSVEPFDDNLVQSMLIDKYGFVPSVMLLRRYPAYDPIMADKAIIYFGDIDEVLIPSIKMLGYQFDFERIKKRIVKMTDYPDKVYTTPPLKVL